MNTPIPTTATTVPAPSRRRVLAAGAIERCDEAADDHAGRAAPAAVEAIGIGGTASGGPAAVADALRAFAAQSARHTPWMTAAVLAASVGAAGVHDPQFEADVEALYAAGTIRLMSGDKAGGVSFYDAMLVPPVHASEAAETAEAIEAMPIPVD